MTRSMQDDRIPSIAAQSEQASTIGSGVPRLICPDADLVSKGGGEQDSWFVISRLESDRGVLNLMVHYIMLQPPSGDPFVQSILTVLDPESGEYQGEEVVNSPAECVFSRETCDVRTPMGTLAGTRKSMHITAQVDGLSVDLTATTDGPVLANLGTGALPFYGNINYEYAFPSMSTTGSVAFGEQTYSVTGTSWFDRQWGLHDPRFWTARKWTWFGMSLDNGVRLSIWDIHDSGREHAFVTVLHPNGLHEVADVEPGLGASDLWTSDATGFTYPTRWNVSIPALDADLHIEPLTREQEIVSPLKAHKYEGASAVEGTIRGEPVTGHAVAELVGNWF